MIDTNKLIRKISLNDPVKGLSYVVGGRVGPGRNLEVTDIVFDDQFLERFGISRYHIFASTGNGDTLWKTIENIPVLVEYNLDPDNLIEL